MVQRSVEQPKCNGKNTTDETDSHKEEQQRLSSNTNFFVCTGHVYFALTIIVRSLWYVSVFEKVEGDHHIDKEDQGCSDKK